MPAPLLIPDDFEIPEGLTTDRLRLRPLTIHDLESDYEAVMSSIDHLRRTQPFGPDHDWPTPELSRDQNLIDLGWHQKEFQNRTSFTYTVTDPGESFCLGCVYIYPSDRPSHDAMVMLWIRGSEAATGLDEHLLESVRNWIGCDWPFSNPGYPGRTLSWDQWRGLPTS